jgi:lipid-A-disaccharide synthase
VDGRQLRIGMVAGEASGDYLGAELLGELGAHAPGLIAEGIGGPRMQDAGLTSIYPMAPLSVMGLVEVLGRYRELAALRRGLVDHFAARPPDIFIGIDAPDFNLELERRLHALGIRTVHYVSPQVWAWREYRLRKIAGAVDLMLTLFPFETDWYQARGMRSVCVGHPLAKKIPDRPDAAGARARLGLPQDKTIIALMPGSRRMEVDRLARPFLLAAALCRKARPEICFASSLVDDQALADMQAMIRNLGLEGLSVSLYKGRSHEVLEAADAALLASGTITLEAMLFKKPMVVAYKVNWLTYYLLKPLIRVDFVSLPNLLAGEELVPECLQSACTPERLARAILHWLDDTASAAALRDRFSALHRSLLPASAVTAGGRILELVRQR